MKISHRIISLIGFAVIVLILGFAAYLQYQKGISPCPLCLFQRGMMYLLGLFFLLGAIFKIGRKVYAVLALSASVIGVILASRQIWIQHAPAVSDNCIGSLQYMLKVLPWNEVIINIFKGTAECTKPGWQFLNLNLAEWSLLSFLFFTVLSVILLWRKE